MYVLSFPNRNTVCRLSARNYCLLHTSQVHCLPIHGTCTLKTDPFLFQKKEIAERRGSGAAANASSATHGLDIRSRKTLAECMCCSAVRADGTGKDGAALGALSKKLNLARREMVDRFRTAAKRFSEDVCDVSGTSINSRNEQDEDTDDLDAEIAFVAEMAKSESEFIELCRAAGVGGG